MKMKKRVCMLLLGALLVVNVVGCSANKEEEQIPEVTEDVTDEVADEGTDEVTEEATEEVTDETEEVTEEVTDEIEEVSETNANLYYPDDELLEMLKVECQENVSNEQELYDAWEKYAKLDTDTQVLGFDGVTLDISGQFAVLINNFGTSGELMYIEGLATTFKEYYDLDEIYLTIEGEVLETGHNIYDYAL